MILILLTVLLTNVDLWECLSDDTVALLLRFKWMVVDES